MGNIRLKTYGGLEIGVTPRLHFDESATPNDEINIPIKKSIMRNKNSFLFFIRCSPHIKKILILFYRLYSCSVIKKIYHNNTLFGCEVEVHLVVVMQGALPMCEEQKTQLVFAT